MAVLQQSLDDLKAANARADEEALTKPQTVEVETEAVAAEVIPEVVVEGSGTQPDAETETEATDNKPDESWMSSDGANNAEPIPNSAWKAARLKYDEKLEKVKTGHSKEVEKLRQENEQLKNGAQTKQLNRPTRSEFDEHDDPEGAYIDAITDFKLEQNAAKQAARTTQEGAEKQQLAQQAVIDSSLDEHYGRAAKLAEATNITAELFSSSDKTIRTAIDAIYPGDGDVITDRLIEGLGAGSEKVFYGLGVNEAKRDKLTSLLTTDPTGIKAAMYLGTLKSELNAPNRKTTNAPAPAPTLQGDGATIDPHKKLKKAYEKASASGDVQSAFNARMAAKKVGANVKTW